MTAPIGPADSPAAPGNGRKDPARIRVWDRGAPARLDADIWRKLRDSTLSRLVRWLLALAVVTFYLPHGSGTRHYVDVGAIVVLLLFPEAQSIGFGGIKFEMRRTADEVIRLGHQVQRVETVVQSQQSQGQGQSQRLQAIIQLVQNAQGAPEGLSGTPTIDEVAGLLGDSPLGHEGKIPGIRVEGLPGK